MSDYHYNEEMGYVDANGNLTDEGKLGQVMAVVGRFHVDRNIAKQALIAYNWDMDQAVNYLAIGNPNLQQYLYTHPDEVHNTLYSLPDESMLKLYKEHETAINTAANIYYYAGPILVMGAFIFILACFGL